MEYVVEYKMEYTMEYTVEYIVEYTYMSFLWLHSTALDQVYTPLSRPQQNSHFFYMK